MSYGFVHEDKVYGPDGRLEIKPEDTEAYNKALEEKEIEWLKTGPEKVFLYVKHPAKDPSERPGNAHMCDIEYRYQITTWLSTVVSQGAACWVGQRSHVGFGSHTYRRPVSARIFGVLYHGWYFESSGNYCRLKRAKRGQNEG